MKTNHFLLVLVAIYSLGFGLLIFDNSNNQVSNYYQYAPHQQFTNSEQVTNYNPLYTSFQGEHEPLDIQCPIPMEDRVLNYTGIQCVWSSIEMLGRWAEEPKLTNPPITSRSNCKSYSSPSLASQRLMELGVKFKQISSNRQFGLDLIRLAMQEGRGCLFSVPGHAMVLVHFDEQNNEVKWVDNSDRALRVQTMTIQQFLSRWDGWVLVIYADNDIIPDKMARIRNPMLNIGIIDKNNPQGLYPRDYIPMPLNY